MVNTEQQGSPRRPTEDGDAPRGLDRFLPAVLITAAVALAVILVPLLTVDPEPPAPTPEPGVVAAAGEIAIVPEADRDIRRSTTRDLSRLVKNLYDRAFITDVDLPDATAAPSPSPGPAARIRGLFTRRARAALRVDPDVFDTGPLIVRSGRVSFGGLVTLRDGRPVEALLDVDFRAVAEAPASPPVAVRQRGDLFLTATRHGWRVAGFELRLTSEPIAPSPSPTATDAERGAR